MMFPESEGMKVARSDYQEFRQKAAKTSYNLGEWGESDIVEYDLDEGWDLQKSEAELGTSGLGSGGLGGGKVLPVPTGRHNPETYTEDRPLDKRGERVDIRTLKDR